MASRSPRTQKTWSLLGDVRRKPSPYEVTAARFHYHFRKEPAPFELDPGTICALVGVNGSGKSTIFKTIMGFVRPSAGEIRLGGRPVAEALKRNVVAYVPQTEEVDWNFPILVEDVVMMGRYGHMNFLRMPSRADRYKVDEALERVGMSGFRSRQIGELSGGQKKRVFLARSLAQEGRIMVSPGSNGRFEAGERGRQPATPRPSEGVAAAGDDHHFPGS